MKKRVETNLYKGEAIAADLQGVRTSITELNNYIQTELSDIEEQIDGKIETWYQASDPSTNWTSRIEHEGDIWYNTETQITYRYTGSAWQETKTTPPSAVLDEIDGKATVFVGSTTPLNPMPKDLWFKGTDEGIFTYVNDEWIEYNKYTDDTRAEQAVNLANNAQGTATNAFNRATAEYGVCNVSAGTSAKTVTIENFTLYEGATCTVTFTNKNTASNPTLNVNGTGAKTIYARGSSLSASSGYNWEPGATVKFVYDGTYWVMMPLSMQEAVNVLAGTNANQPTQIMYVDNGRVYINADCIATGSLDASIIQSTQLNAANITVGKIQGSQIEASAISTSHLASNAVTADKIKAGEVTADALAVNSITRAKIMDGEVITSKIANNNVTVAKMGGSITNGNWGLDFTNGTFSIGELSADKITSGYISADRIQAGTITGAKLSNGSVTSGKIADNNVTVAKMSGSITNGNWGIDFTNGTFSIGELSADKITSGYLSANRIEAGTITGAKLASNAVTSAKIADNNVTVAKMSGSITNNDWSINFTNGTLTIGEISASKIKGDTLTLGGGGNINGVLEVKDESNVRVGYWDNSGLYIGNIDEGLINANFLVTSNGTAIFGSSQIPRVIISPSSVFSEWFRGGTGQAVAHETGELEGSMLTLSRENGGWSNVLRHDKIELSHTGDNGLTITASGITSGGKDYVDAKTKAYAGDTIPCIRGPYIGHVTTGGKQLVFFIPFAGAKSLEGRTIDTITPPTSLSVRGTSGYVGGSEQLSLTGLTWSGNVNANGLQISVTSSTAYTNVTNNTPVSVMIGGTLNVKLS